MYDSSYCVKTTSGKCFSYTFEWKSKCSCV